MTDLLTHVLVAYAVVMVCSWQVPQLTREYVPIGMAGAVVPDLAKINYVVPTTQITDLIGLPFSWLPFHRLGGMFVIVSVLTLLFARKTRRKVFILLLLGAGSHLLLDTMIKRANGTAPPYLYPVSWWRPPAGNLYLSSDVWPVMLAIVVAGSVFFLTHYRSTKQNGGRH